MPEAEYRCFPEQTRAVWFTVRIPAEAKAGPARLKARVTAAGKTVADLGVTVTVVGALLPKPSLLNTHWFHNDCLMSHYRVAAWSPEHWRIAEAYLRNAADHGINTILTPLFTPPLDTAVGTERPTVQLVDVDVVGPGEYRFGFRRLERWMDLTRACGMTHFELSHLATQWGARAAPKIIANVGGKPRRIFGWETDSAGESYRRFLLQFLPQLVRVLRRKKALDRSFLHVSDEPKVDHMPNYRAVREILRQGAPELPVVEALSNIEFYEHGLVDRPCPATNHVEPFLERRVPHLWTYYCCGQAKDVSNRFTDFPSPRNRALGWQLYKFGYEGFLHWGYNHWYDRLSDALIDPYTNSHAGRPLPPGDGFVVYPGKDGPVDALRWEVFREGLQDLRALQLLERLSEGRRAPRVRSLLALNAVRSMKVYPRAAAWITRARQAVNREIARLAR